MYSPIPNPPSKFACPCFAWTQQQRNRVYGPQEGSTYKAPAFEFKSVETIERPKKLLCQSCCEYLFAKVAVEPKFKSVVLGKRLAPDDRDLNEITDRPMTVSIERLHCDSCAGIQKITRKYFSVPKDERDHRGTLPAPKRRIVDPTASETQKKEMKQKTATPRRPSPTRACAKLESRKRRMRVPRICLNQPRKDCCFNAMDFRHTGSSPQIPNRVYAIPSSPANRMRKMPVASSNSGSPVSPPTTTSILLSPVVPGKECTMDDAPTTQRVSIKLNVKKQTTPSPIAPKSATSKARPPPSASIKMTDTLGQRGPFPPTFQPATPPPPTRRPVSTAEEVRALIPAKGMTPTELLAKAGLAQCGKAKLAEIDLLWKTVARVEGKKLYLKSVDNTGGQVKTAGTAMTGVAMESPSTFTPSAPAVGVGYSTSTKACQPQKRTTSQAAQQTSASAASTNSNVFVSRKPKPKKQTPTPGVNILMKQANAAPQTSSSSSVQPQEQRPIPGLFLLSQESNGPKPNLFPRPSQPKTPSRQPHVANVDEDEEL